MPGATVSSLRLRVYQQGPRIQASSSAQAGFRRPLGALRGQKLEPTNLASGPRSVFNAARPRRARRGLGATRGQQLEPTNLASGARGILDETPRAHGTLGGAWAPLEGQQLEQKH